MHGLIPAIRSASRDCAIERWPTGHTARRVLAIVPEARKAGAVYQSLRGPISEDCPGSILRKTPHAHLFLDRESAARV